MKIDLITFMKIGKQQNKQIFQSFIVSCIFFLKSVAILTELTKKIIKIWAVFVVYSRPTTLWSCGLVFVRFLNHTREETPQGRSCICHLVHAGHIIYYLKITNLSLTSTATG